MLRRTRSRSASVPWKPGGMTLPPAKPSSTISMKRTLGVNSEVTLERSTPGRKNTSSVTCFSRLKNSALKISPCLRTSATITRLAPPKVSRCSVKVCM